jgi:hypothetical protein
MAAMIAADNAAKEARQSVTPLTPQQKKFAQKWLGEVRMDAEKQKNDSRRHLLEELARHTEELIKASFTLPTSEDAIKQAKRKLQNTILEINKEPSLFSHIEKGKYSPEKILLAIATLGLSIAIVGVREKKIIEKPGEDLTSKLEDVIELPKLR